VTRFLPFDSRLSFSCAASPKRHLDWHPALPAGHDHQQIPARNAAADGQFSQTQPHCSGHRPRNAGGRAALQSGSLITRPAGEQDKVFAFNPDPFPYANRAAAMP
jgi:hypothetical protein